jgi:hypothetical protein
MPLLRSWKKSIAMNTTRMSLLKELPATDGCSVNPNGIASLSPRVARNELPWEWSWCFSSTPPGLRQEMPRRMQPRLGLIKTNHDQPRVGARAIAPTLGFETESRWDSKLGALEPGFFSRLLALHFRLPAEV